MACRPAASGPALRVVDHAARYVGRGRDVDRPTHKILYELTADQVAGVIFAPEKQRGGVYGTAPQMASCLTNRQVTRWVRR